MAYDIDRLPNLIVLENEGDTSVASIAFDVSAWDALYPAGVYSIRYTRCGETDVYPEASGNVSHAEGVLTWTPGAAVLDVPGRGSVVIRCTEADVLKHSRMTYYYVVPGMTASLVAPDPLLDYIEKWGAADITLTEKLPGEALTQGVTQDATGTHFALQVHAGNGIASIVRTTGDGLPGTTDTYTITFDDDTAATFDVTHGFATAEDLPLTDSGSYFPTDTVEAALQTMGKRTSGFINVKEYGAVGDGTADDTTAMQNAVDSLTSGGILFFPAGDYAKSAVLTIETSNIKIIFAPNAKITETEIGVSAFAISTNVSNVTFDSVNVYGACTSTGAAAYAVSCESGSHDITFINCLFSGYTGGPLYNYLNYNMVCDKCRFYNMVFIPGVGAGGYGITFQASHDTRTVNCYFDGTVERHHLYIGRNPINTAGIGYNHVVAHNVFIGESKANYATGFEYLVKVMGNKNVTITGNVFIGGVGHLWFTNAGSVESDCSNISVIGNTFSDVSKGDSTRSTVIGSDGVSWLKNSVISGNVIKGCDCIAGIKLMYADDVIITGNVIESAAITYGIMVDKRIVNSLIFGNKIDGADDRGIQLGTSYASGDGSQNVNIANNIITATNMGIFTIALESGVIENNHISGGAQQCIYLYGSVKFVGTIRGNILKDGNYGIYLNAACTDPIYVYGNQFIGQSYAAQIGNSGSAYLLEPDPNAVVNSAGVRGNVRTRGAAAPSTLTWYAGDFVEAITKAEAGSSGSKYVINGWLCVTSGNPGTWIEQRMLTGN